MRFLGASFLVAALASSCFAHTSAKLRSVGGDYFHGLGSEIVIDDEPSTAVVRVPRTVMVDKTVRVPRTVFEERTIQVPKTVYEERTVSIPNRRTFVEVRTPRTSVNVCSSGRCGSRAARRGSRRSSRLFSRRSGWGGGWGSRSGWGGGWSSRSSSYGGGCGGVVPTVVLPQSSGTSVDVNVNSGVNAGATEAPVSPQGVVPAPPVPEGSTNGTPE